MAYTTGLGFGLAVHKNSSGLIKQIRNNHWHSVNFFEILKLYALSQWKCINDTGNNIVLLFTWFFLYWNDGLTNLKIKLIDS